MKDSKMNAVVGWACPPKILNQTLDPNEKTRWASPPYDSKRKTMKINSKKNNPYSFWIGILFSLLASFALSVICAGYLGFGILPMWLFIAGFVTLMGVMVIGIPVVLALKEFNKDTCLNAGLSGGFIVFIIILGLSGLSLNWFSSVFIIYGFVCGFAFMCGIKQDSKK